MEPIASVPFVDGITWHVYETPDGRQHVIDDDGEPVYGVWFIPREEWDRMFPRADQPVIIDPDW